MNKLAIALISATAITAVSMAANAQIAPSSAQRFYVTGAAGYAKNALNKDNWQTAPADSKDFTNTGMLLKAGVGFQANKNLAVELNYISLPNVDVKNHSADTQHDIKSAYDVALMAKVMYPINPSVNLFADAGAAYSAYTAGDTFKIGTSKDPKTVTKGDKVHAIVPILGAGVAYNINKNVSVGAEGSYQVAIKNVPSNYFGAVDLRYTF